VIVLVGEDTPDISVHRPQAIRKYAEGLRVPLVVWSADKHAENSEWGQARTVSSAGRLSKASRDVMRELQRQWIVWIEGRHLPSDIEIAPDSAGLQLAGTQPIQNLESQ
jgi:hypothetical protein